MRVPYGLGRKLSYPQTFAANFEGNPKTVIPGQLGGVRVRVPSPYSLLVITMRVATIISTACPMIPFQNRSPVQ
jgi:hypothetical protein